jgi:hypothetical protein
MIHCPTDAGAAIMSKPARSTFRLAGVPHQAAATIHIKVPQLVVRILLEPRAQPPGDFALEPGKGNKPSATSLTVDGNYIVIEFDKIRDGDVYTLVHFRRPTGGRASERDVGPTHLNGPILTDPSWVTPGRPSAARVEKKDNQAKTTPPAKAPPLTKDELLQQNPKPFFEVSVVEPEIEDNP